MAADTCRLCLRPIDQAKSSDLLTETTKLAMLKEFLPEMNLDITENTEVCNNCMEELETSFNFKNGVVVNEANIQAKLEGKKQKKIDLKLMLDDVAKKELKKSDYICRTCLSICKSPSISLFDSPSNMMPYSFVKKMCEVVFELEFIASAKPVLCDDCWETLQTVYNFRKSCLRTDERLRIYVGSKNVTKLSIDDFKKFAEENPVKDEDEDFSDEELDGYVKDEPIDEEELKIDPEEASCSSSSVKVKQETEVKSESELNSDDEVKEDEPELLDPKAVKSEADGLDGGDCKMEIGDVKVDAEGGDAAGTSGARRRAKCVRLLPNHRGSRVEWATDKLAWQDEWRNCFFCDETRFNLIHSDGRVLVWRQPGERLEEENMAPQEAFGGGGLNVWAGVMYNGRSELYISRGTVNAAIYRNNILHDILIPYAENFGEQFIIVDDNARPHRARMVQEFLGEHNIQQLHLPPKSPDLIIIEHVWSRLKLLVRSRENAPQTLNELALAIEEAKYPSGIH